MVLTVLFYSFIGVAVIQIIYYILYATLMFKGKERKFAEHFPPASLLVYTKNHLESLKENHRTFLDQNYPDFEVVFINNASSDETADFLEEIEERHPHVKVVNVENNEAFWASKKWALTLGIKAAKHDFLVFSDARATPISEFWLSNMMAEFSEEKQIVIGHTANTSKNGFINLLVKYYATTKSLHALSFANLGSADQAHDYNFAFHRSLFFKVKGYVNHMRINFAEADLFLKDAATKKNTAVCLSKNGVVTTQVNQTFSSFIDRIRQDRFLKKEYKDSYSFNLTLFSFSKFLFYSLGLALYFFLPWEEISIVLGTYFLILILVVGLGAKRLNAPIFILFLPFLDLINLLVQIVIFIADSIRKPTSWN